jgi:flagellar hook-length control protein FliK
MAMATKISYDYDQSSIGSSNNTSATSSLNKSDSSKFFQEALNSKKSEKQADNNATSTKLNDKDNSGTVNEQKSSNEVQDKSSSNKAEDKDSSEINKLKDKLEELDKESKSASKDKINDVLNELMNLLAQLGINQKDMMSTDGKTNSDALQKMIENTSSSNNLNSAMDNLMKLLQTSSVKDELDAGSLNLIQKILGNMNDNSNSSKEVKSGIKDLMSEISNILDEKQNGKVLTLEDLLNKNYSQNSNENSTENESSNSNTLPDNKETSKEDKFLNSLADDKGNATDKINLFASRNQVIQNQVVQNQGTVDASKNLVINKATLVQDVIKDVSFMNNNGLKELTVKINPDNLGEVTISLTQEDGVMKANLKATSSDTANLLAQNLTDIKNQLNDKNIRINEINIELYQEDTTFFKNGNFDGQFTQDQQRNSNSANKNGNEKISSEDYLTDSSIQAIDNRNVNFLA